MRGRYLASFSPALGHFPLVQIVMPGLGFSRDGHRLGRGGGYYDKFIEACHQVGGWAAGVLGRGGWGGWRDSSRLAKVAQEAHEAACSMVACAPRMCCAFLLIQTVPPWPPPPGSAPRRAAGSGRCWWRWPTPLSCWTGCRWTSTTTPWTSLSPRRRCAGGHGVELVSCLRGIAGDTRALAAAPCCVTGPWYWHWQRGGGCPPAAQAILQPRLCGLHVALQVIRCSERGRLAR